MARNNQAEDRYNPPSVAQAGNDFEPINFSEVEESDLFWLREGGGDNPAYRKISDTEAGNTKTRVLQTFGRNDRVFQRT